MLNIHIRFWHKLEVTVVAGMAQVYAKINQTRRWRSRFADYADRRTVGIRQLSVKVKAIIEISERDDLCTHFGEDYGLVKTAPKSSFVHP